MLTKELDIRLELGYFIRKHFNSLEIETFGAEILQTARIELMAFGSSDNVMDVLEDAVHREEFFMVVERKTKLANGLDDILDSNPVIVHDGRVLCNTSYLLGPDMRKIIDIPDVKTDERDYLTEMIRILESGEIGHVREAYFRNLACLYERVRNGQIPHGWKGLTRNHISFLAWDVNLRGVIKNATEKHILPYYECTKEDLPIQGGLQEQLQENNIYFQRRFPSVRDAFVFGYPEMENSDHWHVSRWGVFSYLSIEEYLQHRVDYLFKHRLGCKTKDGVKQVINDRERLKQAARVENILSIFFVSGTETFRKHPYSLIKDLEGDMYDIDPWEFDGEMPRRHFLNEDDSFNREVVGKYLLWVEENHGLPLNNPRDPKLISHIPHYYHVRQNLSASEIREIHHEAKTKQANSNLIK